MAKVVEGLDQTLKALRDYYPELYKELNREIRPVMKQLQSEARSFVSDTAPLSGWAYKRKDGKEPVSRTSRTRAFPRYDASIIRRGITYSLGMAKRQTNGWVTAYSLFNRSAVGAIYETAGRLNPNGNSKKGANFIKQIQKHNALYRVGTSPKSRGRIIFQAVNKDEGHARAVIEHSIAVVSVKTQKKVA